MNPLRTLVQNIKEDPHNHVSLIDDFVKSHDFPLVKGDQATFFFWDNSRVDEVFLRHFVYGLESLYFRRNVIFDIHLFQNRCDDGTSMLSLIRTGS